MNLDPKEDEKQIKKSSETIVQTRNGAGGVGLPMSNAVQQTVNANRAKA